MQVGKVSWVGQTFALGRCSDSQGKKPRSRRTKEERRKMVDSFIKRYRDSNNGNFPSLNLTHKEVGGSFYTVREIVREIIQENKVLRPGSLNSQSFNLDDCSEQHLPEPSSSDYLYNVLLKTIEHSSDERQMEALGRREIENVNELLPTFSDKDTTNIQKESSFHSQGILVPQVTDGGSYEEQHFMGWHSNVDSENEESIDELMALSGQGQHYSPTQPDEKSFVEVKDSREDHHTKCEIEDPVGFSQPLPTTSTLGVSIPKDIKSDMQVSDIKETEVIYSSAERVKAFKTDYACGKLENMSSSGHGGSSSKHTEEADPLQSMDSNVSGPEQTSFENAGILDTCGLTEASVLASKSVSYMPVYSDPTLNSKGDLSSTTVDQKAAKSVEAPIVDLGNCPTHVQPPPSSSNGLHLDVVTSTSGRASGGSGLENCIGNSNVGGISTSDGTNREPSEAQEKVEDTEGNPILAIIKSLVTAFIKFWTE